MLLRSRDFEVLIWDDLDREQCLDLEKKSSLPVKTARWIPEVTESGCYILTDKRNGRVQQEAWGPMKASDSGPRTLDDEQYDKLIGDDYNVNMRDLYKNAIWCAATDEEEHSAADIFGEGSDKIPRCLFNLPVKRAKWVHKFHGDSYFEITKENFK